MIGIYRINNKKTGKSYIGQSIEIETRVEHHFTRDPRSYIYRAINKHGRENFDWEVLEICEESNLDSRECHWISALDTIKPNGYNLKSGGANGRPSTATKQKMSKSKQGKKNYWHGRKLTAEHREKLSKSQQGKKSHMFGKKRPEYGRKISKIQVGRKLSEETKRKISKAQRERHRKKKSNPKQLTFLGERS